MNTHTHTHTQVFWHFPLKSCWLITYQRLSNATLAPPPVEALSGPVEYSAGDVANGANPAAGLVGAGDAQTLPPGAYHQRWSPSVGSAPLMGHNAMYWAGAQGRFRLLTPQG
jgi:hypothetical protein